MRSSVEVTHYCRIEGIYKRKYFYFMNQNSGVIIGGVVVVLILLGGLFMYTQSNPSPTASSTPTGVDTTDGTVPDTQARTVGAPVAKTNSNVSPTDTTAVVVGGVIPNGAFTSYWYEYGASNSHGVATAKQNIGSGYVELAAPAYITQLAKDTTYYFRLIAENSVGKSTGAIYTFRTTVGTPAPVGSIPTTKTLGATAITRTSANINGEVTPNKGATKYWFEYGDTANLGAVSALQSVGDGSVKVSASLALSNLAPATTYYFRLNAQNQFGTTNGAILTFKTSGPPLSAIPVVTTLVAGPVATTTATLRGTVNPYSTQTTYWFEYSTDSSLVTSLRTTQRRSAGGAAATVSVDANVSSLNSNTTYYYRTVAENAAGTVRGELISFKTN